MNEQRAAFFADDPGDDDELIDPTPLKSFDVPVDEDFDPFDDLYELP